MKKILFTLAAAIITAGTAYANWQEGSTSSLAVSGGEAASRLIFLQSSVSALI